MTTTKELMRLADLAEGAMMTLCEAIEANAQQKQEATQDHPAAVADVLAERHRQITVEGWDDIHDDMNDRSELAQAAACYALHGTPADEAVFIHGRWEDPRGLFWPRSWDIAWWKPTDRRTNLVKAAALIIAEIERLDRAEAAKNGSGGEK